MITSPPSRIEQHRSLLFVPATRPDRITRALACGADKVIVDLEDAVAPGDKQHARQQLHDYLADNPHATLLVRINAAISPEFSDDLALCARFDNIKGVMLPKAETRQQIQRVAYCGKPVWPIIESAHGLSALPDLSGAEGIARLSFGALDLAADLNLESGTTGANAILDQCRYQLIVASRTARLPPPLESVVPDIQDMKSVRKAASRAVEMGFSGMLCIHPRQVAVIHQAFTPDDATIDWAHRVINMSQRNEGAFQLDGQMVDEPVVLRARTLLSRAELKDISS